MSEIKRIGEKEWQDDLLFNVPEGYFIGYSAGKQDAYTEILNELDECISVYKEEIEKTDFKYEKLKWSLGAYFAESMKANIISNLRGLNNEERFGE